MDNFFLSTASNASANLPFFSHVFFAFPIFPLLEIARNIHVTEGKHGEKRAVDRLIDRLRFLVRKWRSK